MNNDLKKELPLKTKGQDLSNCDFSGRDIRGWDFSESILTNSNFSNAIAGTKPSTKSILLIIFTFSQLVFSLLLEFAGQRSGDRFIIRPTGGISPDESGIGLWIALFTITMYATSAATICKGVETSLRVTTGVGIVGILLALGHVIIQSAARLAYENSFETIALHANRVIAPTITGGVTGLALLIVSMVTGIVIACARIVGGKKARSFITIISYFIVTVVAGFMHQTGNHIITVIVSWIIGLAGVYFGNQTATQILENDSRFHILKSIAVALSAIGGTKFKNATLTNVNFYQAKLKSTDFRQTTVNHGRMDRVCWLRAEYLDFARFGNTILDDLAVRELLRTGKGEGYNYQGKNLKGAYLVDAKLAKADLTEADISHASLERADLVLANLKKVQALGTNFYRTNLTACCIEAWNVDSTTQLKGSRCDHVYLLAGAQERCPSSGDFQDGDFGKLFQKVISTVDFIFRNGIDWQAFIDAFEQVKIENEDAELTIQSIENKGDDVVIIKVSAPPDIKKSQIHSQLVAKYESALILQESKYVEKLAAKENEIDIYRRQSADLSIIVKMYASAPKVMNFNGAVNTVIGKISSPEISSGKLPSLKEILGVEYSDDSP
jgi:uncharacterized protein YjbI with pentapeptide repeats